MNSDEKKAFDHLHSELEKLISEHNVMRAHSIALQSENTVLKAQVKDLSEKLAAVVPPVDESPELVTAVEEMAAEIDAELADAQATEPAPAPEEAHAAEEPAPEASAAAADSPAS
jgi:regulator of replication initiation timing